MRQLNVASLTFIAFFLCVVFERVTAKVRENVEIITEYKPDDCHKTAQPGDEVIVHFTGALENGVVFDTSLQGDREPFSFTLGEGKVIPGWEQGLKDMCIGEKRKLIIPPHMAYGSVGVPPTIPPESTLLFETELLAIQSPEVSVVDTVGALVQLLAMPGAFCLVLYYIYDKYQKEPTKRELKEERRGKKKKH